MSIRSYFTNSKAYDYEDSNKIREMYYNQDGASHQEIKDEVYDENCYRKLIDKDWAKIYKDIDFRLTVYSDLFKTHDHSEYPFDRKTILIDIMLDKAQAELESRSNKYYNPGRRLLVASLVTLTLFVIYLNIGDMGMCWLSMHTFIDRSTKIITDDPLNYVYYSACMKPDLSDWKLLFAYTFKRVVVGGAILAVSYIFFSLANACFRESTRLLHRRHSIRFIRLLYYKADGEIDDKMLKDAFGIDDVTTSGFDNIKTDAVFNNLLARAIDKFSPQLAERLARHVKSSDEPRDKK